MRANGETLPPIFIVPDGPTLNSASLAQAPAGSKVCSSEKGHMTQQLFLQYLDHVALYGLF